jgi:hypothetical protein
MILIVVAGWPSKLAGDYRALGAGVMLGIYGCLLVFSPKFGVGNRDASLSAHALMRR